MEPTPLNESQFGTVATDGTQTFTFGPPAVSQRWRVNIVAIDAPLRGGASTGIYVNNRFLGAIAAGRGQYGPFDVFPGEILEARLTGFTSGDKIAVTVSGVRKDPFPYDDPGVPSLLTTFPLPLSALLIDSLSIDQLTAGSLRDLAGNPRLTFDESGNIILSGVVQWGMGSQLGIDDILSIASQPVVGSFLVPQIIQSPSRNNANASNTGTLGMTRTTVGSTLVAFIWVYNTGAIPTVTTPAGWASAGGQTQDKMRLHVLKRENAPSITSLLVQLSAVAEYVRITMLELSGVGVQDVALVTNHANAMDSDSGTSALTTQAAEIWIAAFGVESSLLSSHPYTNGFVEIWNQAASTVTLGMTIATQNVLAVGNADTGFPIGTTSTNPHFGTTTQNPVNYVGAMVTFKAKVQPAIPTAPESGAILYIRDNAPYSEDSFGREYPLAHLLQFVALADDTAAVQAVWEDWGTQVITITNPQRAVTVLGIVTGRAHGGTAALRNMFCRVAISFDGGATYTTGNECEASTNTDIFVGLAAGHSRTGTPTGDIKVKVQLQATPGISPVFQQGHLQVVLG